MISNKALITAVALSLWGVTAAPTLFAAESVKLEVQAGDSLQSVLSTLAGKRVQLTLVGGGELGGVVGTVNDKVLLLTEVAGKEFYDAVVSLDKISAVVVRAR